MEAVFFKSLEAAIRDIETHPRGKLFRRLIEFGPPMDMETVLKSDGETLLSDPEWGECVEFVFSHMINRFKGELAELLAMEPCLELFEKLKKSDRLPADTHIYWGDAIKEYRCGIGMNTLEWRGLAKGADGLLVEYCGGPVSGLSEKVRIHGVVEIKSMLRSKNKIEWQIDRHIQRLKGGVKLLENEIPAEKVEIAKTGLIKIMIIPSQWKVNREFHWQDDVDGVRRMVFPKPEFPKNENEIEELDSGFFKITLAWSKEAIEQAAYEMTYGYMAQVGEHVYAGKKLPRTWEGMTQAEAGYNAVKQMLYYMPLRGKSSTKRKTGLAVRLSNVYSFGYPLGIDAKEMLWPEDF